MSLCSFQYFDFGRAELPNSVFMRKHPAEITVDRIEVSTFTVPTDFPEADGTLDWNKTTLVLVVASGGGKQGLGYTYADQGTATLIQNTLSELVSGADALAPTAAYGSMWRRIRNLGRPGICS